MCGIAGVVFGQRRPAPESVGRGMCRHLRHRGPDAEGWAELPEHQGVFAHARLSIIDLSDRARQPFWSPCGQVVLIFNGEIYDFKAQRDKLTAAGAQFRSQCDTEVVLQSYLMHGPAGLDALDGMFAIALYDARERRLLLMRDRTGKKPLYWTRQPDGSIAFASEVKALTALPEIQLAPDPDHVAEYLTFGYVGTPRSLFKGLHKLPAATRMLVKAGGEPQMERYWQLPSPASMRNVGAAEALQEVRQTIGAAVERRMVADVPLGAFLSGGVDSSVIVAEMARRGGQPVRTFAVGFDDDKTFDERSYAKEIADRFGTDHTELVVKATPCELLGKLLWHHDEPYGDSSALAVYAVSKATADHVSVVLTGDGGDEVYGGYTRFHGGVIAERVPNLAARTAHKILGRLPEPKGYKNPISLARRFVEHAERSEDEQLLAWNSYFAGDALGRLLNPDLRGASDPWSVMAPQLDLLRSAREDGADRLDQILRHNLDTYLLDDLLVKTDRMTMAVSLEARSPFLDTAVLESAFTLPSALKIKGRSLKWLLKEAYRGILPDHILDRQKHGFGVPVGAWWRGEARPMVQDILLSKNAKYREVLNQDEVQRLVKEHDAQHRDHGQRIFALLQLELWLQSLPGS